MCTYVPVHMQPLAPPVCVWAIPAPPPTPFSQGEGAEGNTRGNGRGRGPGVLIQTHRGASRSRATCITPRPPPPVSPQLLPRQQEEPRASPGTASPSCCPGAAGDRAVPEGGRSAGVAHATVTPKSAGCTHGRAPSTARGLGGATGAAMFQCGVTAAPGHGIRLCAGTLPRAGGTMRQLRSQLTGHRHCPPDLTKGQGHTELVSSLQQGLHRHVATGLVLSHIWQWPLGYPKGATYLPSPFLLLPCCPKGDPPKGLQALLRKWLL